MTSPVVTAKTAAKNQGFSCRPFVKIKFSETWPGHPSSDSIAMKILSFRSLLLPLLMASLFAFTGSLHGAPIDLLRQAYITLGQANHDYKGHRMAAMRQVEAAAKVLGGSLRGGEKNREPQGVSDDQLRAAQSLLQDAAAGLSGRALKHVMAAERQINVALSIR
jgi:hypothetical protein